MGIGRIAENGIFEVGKGIYSRTYRFLDINYVTAGAEEQMRILKQYCKTVNAIDIYFLITIFNRNKNMQDFREHVLFQEKGDGFNWLRGSYNQIIEKRIVDGRQGIEQEKLLTVCVERKSYEQAKAFFATFEATLKQNFGELGSCIEELNAEERLRVLFNFYRIGEEEQFSFDFRQALKKGGDPKNDISPGYMQFYPGYFETERKKCRALFIKKYPSSLSDTFLNEITSLPVHSITTICIVPVPKELANKVLQKKYLGIENDILKQQRVRNKNNDFSSDISHIKKVQKEKIVNLMDDVRENDQNLFYTGVNFLIMAEDKKELDSVTETIKNIGNGRMCQIETHYYQQREAMNTILPVGNRQISTMRTMLTRDIAALLPFNVQELNEKSGVCYGINQVSHNLCIGNRKKLANGNGMVFGVPGSGKSYFSKSEMLQVFLGTDDDIICIDPTLEYFDIAEALGNQAAIINLSTYTKNYIYGV
ncbi:VirB4-like conjugal transfer ATPase, CD1110 family [Coprococcus comes]|uniref:VirB4-like conjugal transfer ATPase, CD1110 family n=1 Tax=Coprococcus comes TaxID=410072 RepID=UPI003A7F4858